MNGSKSNVIRIISIVYGLIGIYAITTAIKWGLLALIPGAILLIATFGLINHKKWSRLLCMFLIPIVLSWLTFLPAGSINAYLMRYELFYNFVQMAQWSNFHTIGFLLIVYYVIHILFFRHPKVKELF